MAKTAIKPAQCNLQAFPAVHNHYFELDTQWEPCEATLVLLEAYSATYKNLAEASMQLATTDVSDLNVIHQVRLLNSRLNLLTTLLCAIPHASAESGDTHLSSTHSLDASSFQVEVENHHG